MPENEQTLQFDVSDCAEQKKIKQKPMHQIKLDQLPQKIAAVSTILHSFLCVHSLLSLMSWCHDHKVSNFKMQSTSHKII